MGLGYIKNESEKAIFYIFPGLCKGCGLCIEKCPAHTLGWSQVLGVYGTPSVETGHGEKECTGCAICETTCPDCAIHIERIKKVRNR
ncbi:2-oxoglutarate ferredoxin oxidoreductase subunit delta [Desulfotomaculum arcticum]|uniref:2-oxoglutarate ferredoxin oxidoreductase subunit delta n=1 Tax=Desulfotruncus arcticus DSM 17038 TaxID=1121424 RepID=A0A1I2XM70_9FIRM|nr:4Fe-4S dicluster domain-containing protein [Desulfotruncus arcticus]SFH14109.1 2-oxoglutarate ferredoxin oxidoreductase subunit delta [Desulfotomaculum arcticum] [Desulfotruncus arcticus DSM 17038]